MSLGQKKREAPFFLTSHPTVHSLALRIKKTGKVAGDNLQRLEPNGPDLLSPQRQEEHTLIGFISKAKGMGDKRPSHKGCGCQQETDTLCTWCLLSSRAWTRAPVSRPGALGKAGGIKSQVEKA